MRWLSDEELLGRLDELACVERKLIAEVVAHLAEVERRKLHLALGYGSMFAYATERLRFSEQAAYRRIRAARLSLEHPQTIDYLAQGELTIASVSVIAPHADAELLEEARGKSKREVEELIAERQPNSPRGELTVTLTARGADLLREARDLDPASVAELVERSLELFVAQKKKQRFSQVGRPRPAPAKSADNINAATRREVFERDGSRCSFVGVDGKRCESTHLLEYDHVQPRALGGRHDAENLRLLCRAHNQHVAEQVFGADKLEHERQQSALRRDALSALTNLGFKKAEARTVIDQVVRPGLAIEPLLRAALHELRPHP
jgi:5-methylcytosine-specific restriction endonuclease McrA